MIDAGLDLLPDGALLWRWAAGDVGLPAACFPDLTGFEAVANKFYFSDFVDAEPPLRPKGHWLAQALRLSEAVGKLAAAHGCGVCVYVMLTEDDVVWRFHRHRDTDPPWFKAVSAAREWMVFERWSPGEPPA